MARQPEIPLPGNIGPYGPKLGQSLTLRRVLAGMLPAPRGRRDPPYAPPPPPMPLPQMAGTRLYDRGAAGFAGRFGVMGLPFFAGVQALHKGPPVVRSGTVAAPYGFGAYIAGQTQKYAANPSAGPAGGPLYTPQQLMAMLPPGAWPAVLPEWAMPVAPQAGTVPLVSLG